MVTVRAFGEDPVPATSPDCVQSAISFLPPQGRKLSAQQLELEAKQRLFGNVLGSKVCVRE